MSDPPDETPEDDDLAAAVIGNAAIVLGSLAVIAAIAAAIAHYWYGVPAYRRHGYRLADPSTVAFTLIALGLGGPVAIALGIYTRCRGK